ncbi:putative baseplate assembly protein 2 [Bacillus phage BSP38]|uniref:Putative baseplate assembly protein 2 n=1 Tax=Bacillus phage BSP38 TaxID=2283013 RepID=A0A345MJV7_BPBSP|nr:baseplate wedge subunit [Bacillus phage BSP38]AXH71139.1 putative baseplate assembly protein 2 [Bacillus phage BSP38]
MRFKRMSEIYSRLVDHTITHTHEVNDFSVGSAMRAIYEAISIELEQYYILTRENIAEAIEQGVYSSFGFTRKPAIRAYGVVQITLHNAVQQDTVVSRGSRFASSQNEYPQIYETRVDYYIPKGSIMAEMEVYCLSPGATGNIPPNTLDIMQSPIANVRTVTNPAAFQTGQDEEPIEELRSRFRSFIKSLSRATVPAIDYGTRTVPEVAGVYIEEETGRVNVYAHDRNGNLPDDVRVKIMAALYDYRPAGIPVRLFAVTRKNIDVDVTVTLTNKAAVTDTFRTQIRDEIIRYLNNMQTSQSLVLSDLSSVIKYMDRQLIYDVSFTTPKSNVVLKGSEIIRAGEVKVTLQ